MNFKRLYESEKASVEEHCKPCECDGKIYVCFKRNKNTGTIHIFCCECKMDDWGDCKYYCTNKCLCNCIERIEKEDKEIPDFEIEVRKCFSLEEARLTAAQLQNEGYNVCGVCVSALSHNGL